MPHDPLLDYRLPDLRFVPVGSLVPHEEHDEQRLQPLVRRIQAESVLRNPPIVTPLPDDPDGRFVVLDGANRATAARIAGFPHMLVQVVRYEEPWVKLHTWSHALGDYTADDLEATLRGVPGLEVRREPQLHARAMLARREALALVMFEDGHADTLHGEGDLHQRNALLNAVVDTYRGRKRYLRVTTESLVETRARHPEITALIVFPHFEPLEVVELATGGARLPAGITRHLIRWRALRVNVPVELLADAERPLGAKQTWLDDWLRDKVLHRHVRYYEEPTVLFDE